MILSAILLGVFYFFFSFFNYLPSFVLFWPVMFGVCFCPSLFILSFSLLTYRFHFFLSLFFFRHFSFLLYLQGVNVCIYFFLYSLFFLSSYPLHVSTLFFFFFFFCPLLVFLRFSYRNFPLFISLHSFLLLFVFLPSFLPSLIVLSSRTSLSSFLFILPCFFPLSSLLLLLLLLVTGLLSSYYYY